MQGWKMVFEKKTRDVGGDPALIKALKCVIMTYNLDYNKCRCIIVGK